MLQWAITARREFFIVNMTRLHSQPVESFYLETKEGLYFAVKGLVHPPDRIFSVLRYAPDPQGDRKKAGKTYRRLYHFPEQVRILKERYPQYLAYDPLSQMEQQSVPVSSIQCIYDPRSWRQMIPAAPERDDLQADAYAFCDLLAKESGVSPDHLGVSGSLLIDLHTDHSDLDITIHGEQNCRAVHMAMQRLLDEEVVNDLSRFNRQGFLQLYDERLPDTRMEFDEFLKLEKRKSFQGFFRGRIFFIRFIKEPHENGESYGDRAYKPLHQAGVVATVTGESDAIFTPCCYPLDEVQFLQGDPVNSLCEIVSFRGRFCEQARLGERIYAFGTVEHVQIRQGHAWHRLILGNRPEDHMRSWR
jgi:predicted nucleotidyltransferase